MKVYTYITMFTGLMIFLTFLGINNGLINTMQFIGLNITNSSLSSSSQLAQASFNFSDSSFWTQIFGVGGALIVLLAAGGAIVGLFGKAVSPEIITLPIIVYVFVQFLNTGRLLIQMTGGLGQTWLTALIITIFVPLTVGFAISLVEWFRGVID